MEQETKAKGTFEFLQESLDRLSDHNIAYTLAFCAKSTDLLPEVEGKIYTNNTFRCLTDTEAVALIVEMEIVKNQLIDFYGLSKSSVMKHVKNTTREEIGISSPKTHETWFFETEDEAIALACEIKKAYEECSKEQENINPESLIMQYCWSGNLEKVVSLLDSGCNIEGDSATSFEASTPLLYACVSKNMELVKTLIERGANIHATDYIGNGVLMYSHNADLLKLFIEGYKLNPNKQHGKSKYTALMNACRFGYMDSIDYLLSIGADALLRDHSGAQALHWAMECDGNREGNCKIKNYFLDRLAFYKKSHETTT